MQAQNNRELRLTEFTKIAPQFNGQSSDPADVEYWINEVEKAFRARQITDDMKVSLVEFQLKKRANDWWVTLKSNIRVEEMTWQGFKDRFYLSYFPSLTRDQMLSQLWALKQGSKTVTEYEADFNRLVKFSPDGFRDNELMKIKKFRDGLSLELQHDVRGFEITTMGELVTKARMMEELRNKIKIQDNASKSVLGRRSFGYFRRKNYESDLGSGFGKKAVIEKIQP